MAIRTDERRKSRERVHYIAGRTWMSDRKFLMDGSAVTFRHYDVGALFLLQGNLNQYCPYKEKRKKGDDKDDVRNSLFPL